MNVNAHEPIGLGQKALYDVYTGEKPRERDIVDYGLLDTMHEMKDQRYGLPYKPRQEEPPMEELLSGGYDPCQNPTRPISLNNPEFQNMTEDQLRNIAEKLLKKEKTKGKWMTETRDNFRKFTDDPADNVYYIGNQMLNPHKFGAAKTNHYKTCLSLIHI